jgi:hypothetical protein
MAVSSPTRKQMKNPATDQPSGDLSTSDASNISWYVMADAKFPRAVCPIVSLMFDFALLTRATTYNTSPQITKMYYYLFNCIIIIISCLLLLVLVLAACVELGLCHCSRLPDKVDKQTG